MELPPTSLCGLRLPPNVRESLIATFLYLAAGRSGFKTSQSYLACGKTLLLEEEAQIDSALGALAHILMQSNLLMSGDSPTLVKPPQERCDLDLKSNSHPLRIWIALLEAQEMLAQGKLPEAKRRLVQLGHLRELSPLPVLLTPSMMVQSGLFELQVFGGVINFGVGHPILAWHCFQRALRSEVQLAEPSEYSMAAAIGFLQILHLRFPDMLPSDLSAWQSYEQRIPEGYDHRLLLFKLTRCLIHAVYGDLLYFEAIIAPISYALRESPSTVASGFLLGIEQLSRSVVLFRRLGMHYDLQKEIDELRDRCPLYVWLSPTLEHLGGV